MRPQVSAASDMDTAFFYASKVFWFFLDPGNLLLFMLCIGGLALWTRWKNAGRFLISLAAILSFIIFTIPVGNYGLRYLENRFPVNPTLPKNVDGIIVLGGTIDPFITQARDQISLNGNIERITKFSELALKYPQATLVYSSGSGSLTDQSLKEADFVAPILKKLGLNPERVMYENQSRNTVENAALSFDLTQPGENETWILVTSARHMPRAMGCFRKAGWPDITAYPVDFIYKGDEILSPPLSLTAGLLRANSALHEWVGLLAYYVMGKTDRVLPLP